MKVKFPVGLTNELNQLNLPAGLVAIDSERKALRFFDGQTQGGFEVLGEKAVRPTVLLSMVELLTIESAPPGPVNLTMIELLTVEKEV